MKTLIKEIDFDNTKSDNYHFDMVDLEDIFKRKPKDHRQFEHHKVSFYVILIITHEKGKHNINYKDYAYQKRTVFTLRKNNIHKFYKTNAKGKLLDLMTQPIFSSILEKKPDSHLSNLKKTVNN